MSHGTGDGTRLGAGDARARDLGEPYVQKMIDEGDFPFLRRAMCEGVPQQESFEEGLRWLLDGIEREFADP